MNAVDQQIPTGTWHVDRVHSEVGFAVGHTASTFRATFDDPGRIVFGYVARCPV